MIYGHIHSLRPTGGFAGEHVCREIPSSFKTAEIQHASMSCVHCLVVAESYAPFNINYIATFAVADTAGCDSVLACRSLFSGSPLDMNAAIRD